MSALMTIRVQVLSGAALAQLRAVEAQARRTGLGMRFMSASAMAGIPALAKWGNQVQWMGRQLMYNFTLPIVAAMGFAAKWALENEKAMVRVTKVYGDGSKVFKQLRETELPALQRSFEALSNEFGVNQKAVIGVAGDWAAAGATGLALAKVTKLTMETMILGELEAVDATQQLIAIQAQYGMDTKRLTETIDILNMAENETGTTMKDLMVVLSKASGVAKNAGIDVEHLAAMSAALVPATGSAATAGNGLKTVISRLISPTKDAVEVMQLMGIEVNKTAWQTLSGTERLERMSKVYGDLSDAQKVHVATVIGSRYQVNRFSVLMDAMNNKNSYYQKTLDAVSDKTKIYEQRVYELNKVLESNPQKVKQAGIVIQNSMAGAITPLLPTIAYLAQQLARVFQWFQNLDPAVQKLALGILILLAVIGPMLKYLGSSVVMFGTIIKGVLLLTSAIAFLAGGAILSVIKYLAALAATAVIAAAKWTVASILFLTSATRMKAAFMAARAGLIGFYAMLIATWPMKAAAAMGGLFAFLITGLGLLATSFIGFIRIMALAGGWALVKTAAASAFLYIRSVAGMVFTTVGAALVAMGIAIQGAMNAMAIAVAGAVARMAALLAPVFGGVAAAIAGMFSTVAVFVYTALYGSVAPAIARWVALMGAQFTLLPTYLGSAVTAMWAILTVPGMFTGMVLAWAASLGSMLTSLGITTGAMTGMWASFTSWVVGSWVIATGAMSTMLANFLAFFSGGTSAVMGRFAILWAASLTKMSLVFAPFVAGLVSLWSGFLGFFAGGLTAAAGRVAIIWGALMTKMLTSSVVTLAAGWIVTLASMVAGLYVALGKMFTAWVATFALKLDIVGLFRTGFILLMGGLSTFWAAFVWALAMIWSRAWIFMTTLPALLVKAVLFMGPLLLAGLAAIGSAIITVLTSPFTIVAAAILGIMYAFRDQLADAWQSIVGLFSGAPGQITGAFAPIADWFNRLVQNIIDAWWALPEGVRNAIVAVISVVRDAALQIYEWMSYLNPFVRHSPSLVESVTKGMDVIEDQYKRGAGVGAVFAQAARDLAKFKKMTQGMSGGEWGEERADVKSQKPSALPMFDKLVKTLGKLGRVLSQQEAAMNAQQAVVDKWAARLDRANAVLDRQQGKLDRLKDKLQSLQDMYDKHAQAAQDYAAAPIKGMGAMNDQIFANTLAQKKLQLAMMEWEQANGSIDSMRDRLGLLQGDIESLRGRAADLRAQGAGSDILGPIEGQIAALEAQAAAVQNAVNNSPVSAMQSQLEDLQKQGEMLQLQYDIKYDPLTRQIEALANAQKELGYAEIVAGIKAQQAAMAALQPQINNQTAAVAAQQAVVDNATAARDRIQAAYDREKAKLDVLKAAYDKTAEAIQNIETALRDVAAAASSAAAAMDKAKGKGGAGGAAASNVAATFAAGAGGNFPDVGGTAAIGREGGLKDQSKAIDQFSQDSIDEMNSLMGEFNMFDPIKKWWKNTWGWIKENLGPIGKTLIDGITGMFKGIGNGGADFLNSGFIKSLKSFFDTTMDFFRTIGGWFKGLWSLIGDDMKKIGGLLVKFFVDIWNELGPELAAFGQTFKDMGPMFKNLWSAIKPVAVIIGVVLLGALKIITRVLANTLGPLLDGIIAIAKGVIKVIRGIIDVIVGIFSGDFGVIKRGLVAIVSGLWDAIWGIMKNGAKIVWGVVKGFVTGIIDFFKWLYDVAVGHSIIPDLIDAIVFWFKKLGKVIAWVWDNFVKPLVKAFVWLFEKVVAGVKLWWAGVMVVFDVFKTLGTWFWDNVLLPVYNAVVSIWDNWIKPGFSLWWEGVKLAWEGLKNAATWFWNKVLSPVFNAVKKIWKDHVGPAFKAWWAGVKFYWNGLKNAATWFWNNVLVPVFNRVKKIWNENVGPELKKWWSRIQTAWNLLKTAATWFWTNVLSPIFTKAKDLWVKIKGEFVEWRTRFENSWNKLKEIGTWFKTNVMDPIFTGIKTVWGEIGTWLDKNKSKLTTPMTNIVNAIAGAINLIIKGLNKVSDILPGEPWSIPTITPLRASGGDIPHRRVGGGFKTSGARAIVGEGKQNYPEFVIPTDPTYRNRAKSLLSLAAGRLGVETNADPRKLGRHLPKYDSGVPMYSVGGWFGDRFDDVKDFGGKISKVGRNAIANIMNPLLNKGKDIIDDKGGNWKFATEPAKHGIDKIEDWVRGASGSLTQMINKANEAAQAALAGGNVSVPNPDNPSGKMIWKGGTFSNLMVSRMIEAEKIAKASISVTKGGWRGGSDGNSGDSHMGDALDMQVNYALGQALRRVGIATGDRTGLGPWGPHIHAIPGPGAGYAGGSGPYQFQDYMARGGMKQSMTSPWGLEHGALVRRTMGGSEVTVGEGRRDEAIVPLPRSWRTDVASPFGGGSGETHNHFYGDLAFPNVKSGSDAKSFLDNLENLSKD